MEDIKEINIDFKKEISLREIALILLALNRDLVILDGHILRLSTIFLVSNDEVSKLTKWLIGFTIGLFVLTLLLVGKEVWPYILPLITKTN